eukprot:TRINITY_DN1936_c0_g1_i21.p1 TRINITY_DN1936_c0_g1~~TRINITY_DN1936_c0_g1_i21.p1  ORF type:complete len:129 (-),score=48.83 TRINITY_DN1936_c0_g1_i21:454-810(-)
MLRRRGGEEMCIRDRSETEGMLRGNSQITRLNEAIAATKNQMTQNIELELDRANKVKDIHAASENLTEASDMFRKDSVALKRKEFWKRVKCWLCVIMIAIVLIILIVMYFCGMDFSEC